MFYFTLNVCDQILVVVNASSTSKWVGPILGVGVLDVCFSLSFVFQMNTKLMNISKPPALSPKNYIRMWRNCNPD